MTQQYDNHITLGRINKETLEGRIRSGRTLYIETDQPPGVIGYAVLDDTPRQVQRTINDYLEYPDRESRPDYGNRRS